MRCRNTIETNDIREPVFFDSYGLTKIATGVRFPEGYYEDPAEISIPQGVEIIASNFLSNVSSDQANIYIYIPKSVTKFETNLLGQGMCSYVMIFYEGTYDEFEQIEKEDGWKYGAIFSTYEDYYRPEYSEYVIVEASKKSAMQFVKNQEAVAQSLEQQLQVLRGELWYYVNFGLPLFDKVNKAAIDSYVCSIVLNHAEVIRITSFESRVLNHVYSCEMKILSTFGELDLTI